MSVYIEIGPVTFSRVRQKIFKAEMDTKQRSICPISAVFDKKSQALHHAEKIC